MTKQIALPPTLPPRLIGRDASAAYVCVSPTLFDRLIEEGRMPRARIMTMHRKVWDVRELDIYVDLLPRDGDNQMSTSQGTSEANIGWE